MRASIPQSMLRRRSRRRSWLRKLSPSRRGLKQGTFTPEDILRLQAYQIEILNSAMQHVAPGGRIIYSSCSLEPEENEAVVAKAMESRASFRVIECGEELRQLRENGELVWKDIDSLLSGQYLRTVPGVHPCDGFFAAVLERSLTSAHLFGR